MVIMLNCKKNPRPPSRVTISTLPNFPLQSPECDIKLKMAATIQKNNKNKHKNKTWYNSFQEPQNKPTLKIKVTNIISSKNYLTLQLIQVSSSCVHELSVEGWVKETWVSRNPIKFHQPLTLPSPLPPSLPPSFNLLTLQAAVGNQESIRVWCGKNQRHAC